MKSTTQTIRSRAAARNAFVDLTDGLRRAIKDSGVTEGCAVAFCAHTTAALVVNEWEDGALADFQRHLDDLVPHEGVYFAHDDFEIRTQNLHEDERRNGHAHVKAMIMGATSHAIPVVAGEPMFGQWQRLMLLELDEPKDRDVVIHVFGA